MAETIFCTIRFYKNSFFFWLHCEPVIIKNHITITYTYQAAKPLNIFTIFCSITISHFPKKVKKLALRNCSIERISPRKSYLFEIHKLFESLEVLDLQNSNWLSNHSLQSISKIQSVREVNFKGCRSIGECFVYTALSTKMGFRNVKTIDLRDTHIGDSEVPCFGRLPNITHLYLGKYVPFVTAFYMVLQFSNN